MKYNRAIFVFNSIELDFKLHFLNAHVAVQQEEKSAASGCGVGIRGERAREIRTSRAKRGGQSVTGAAAEREMCSRIKKSCFPSRVFRRPSAIARLYMLSIHINHEWMFP